MDIIDHLQDEEEFLLNLKIESRRAKPIIPSATHCHAVMLKYQRPDGNWFRELNSAYIARRQVKNYKNTFTNAL
ncbi:hypothetical protein ACV2Y0_25505 [Enterobacter hormaechei]